MYIFFLYNNSLNMMRQSVACALLLLATTFVLVDKKINAKSLVSAVAAVMFHKSGLYGIAIICVALIIGRMKNKFVVYLLYVGVIAFPLVINPISEWLIASGIANSHVIHYIDEFVRRESPSTRLIDPLSTYSITYITIYISLVGAPILFRSKLFEWENPQSHSLALDEFGKELTRITVTGLLLYIVLLFSLNTMYGQRFSLYCDFFLIMNIALCCWGENRAGERILILMLLVAIWFVWVMCLGWSGSQIYISIFE